jgi:hypothetical protein
MAAPLGRLKYLYVGSNDVAADVAYVRDVLGGVVEWDYEEFDTRVAGVRLADGPLWIIAGHRKPGVLPVFAVPDVDALVAELRGRGWRHDEGPVEIPDGPCYLFSDPSGNQLAVVGEVRPWAEEHLRAGATASMD